MIVIDAVLLRFSYSYTRKTQLLGLLGNFREILGN